MNILEFQAKNLCREYGISVPKNLLLLHTTTVKDAEAFLHFPIVLKAQVFSKRRARTGGISLARSIEEAVDMSARMFISEIHGEPVNKILAEEMIDFDVGYAVQLDYAPNNLSIELSASQSIKSLDENGSQMEQSSQTTPFSIDPFLGITDATVIELALLLEIDKKYWENLDTTLKKLWRMFDDLDATRIAINPLVIGQDGGFYALGVDIHYDRNAAFRQPKICQFAEFGPQDETRSALRKLDCEYRWMDGDGKVGVISRSMPMSTAIVDILTVQGQHVSEIAAIDASATAENVALVLKILERCARSKYFIIHSIEDKQETMKLLNGIQSFVSGSEHPFPIILCINTLDLENVKDIGKSGKIIPICSLGELSAAISQIEPSKA